MKEKKKDREPRDWRAAPSLRRHRPAAPSIHEDCTLRDALRLHRRHGILRVRAAQWRVALAVSRLPLAPVRRLSVRVVHVAIGGE